jgi:GNAT superfamily N-acetyltransferase
MDFSQIRLANMVDAEEIALLFKLVTDSMRANNVFQWHYKYPLVEHVIKDIENKTCYVYDIDGQIAGTITIDSNQDEQYKNVHWKYPDDICYVIHRLGVNPLFQGLGISKTLCYYAEHLALQKNIHYIRLDAYSLNPVSNSLYASLGYDLADGVCFFHGNDAPFNCYEKEIKVSRNV